LRLLRLLRLLRWTEQIHDEWMRNVLKNRADLNKEQLTRTKNLMNRSVRNCLIENYESIIPSLDLPDLYPMKVATVAETCRKRLKNPPKSIDEYLEILLRQGLTITVALLRQYCYEV
jgi:hypothetical protein